jgi:flagellar basal body-associated protein FliL
MAYLLALVALAFVGYKLGGYTVEIEHQAVATKNTYASDVAYLSLPRMTMSITSVDGQAGRLRMDISLEVEKKNMLQLEGVAPVISDRIISYVRKLDVDDMRSTNAVTKLRMDLLREVNSASFPFPVVDIVFRQFLVL